ncbi:MAG: hypothetical protein SWH54_06935 [Thermodesulfobacteriota bacterium]|nr:hypothetical protein [Thermodesulfobacteriota bacterium]
MYLKFMFTNTQPQLGIMSKGRILASCSKLEIPWEKLILSWDKVTALLTKRLGNKKISTDRKSHIKKYSYRTYNLSTAVCLIPAYDEEIDEYHLKLLTNCFYYKCNDLMACKIVFYAISTPEMFKTNSPAYKKMIQTFTIIDEKY